MTGPEVLFITLPAGLGGSVRSMATLLGGLEGRAHRVVARAPDTSTARYLTEHSLADETLDLRASKGNRLTRVTDAVRLARWARGRRGDLIAVHANGLSELNIAVPVARAAGVPVIVWVHDWKISSVARRIAPLLRLLAPRIDWVTVSEASRISIEAARLSGSGSVAVVPNPIDPTELAVRTGGSPVVHGDVRIAYIGSPAGYKGFPLLPATIEALHALVPTATWDIWSGPETVEPETWRALRALPANRVRLNGKTPDVGQAFHAADIVFCPSLDESFGRVAAEAMACGRPVVASNLPALREVLGEVGVLFPPGDAGAAAHALADLASQPARRERLGAAGRGRAAAFAPATVTEEMARRYGLGKATGPRRALVVSHEATRTGAPVVAAQVAAALREDGWRVEVILRAPGPLESLFRDHADALSLEPIRRLRVALRRAGAGRTVANRLDEMTARHLLTGRAPDLVWCNTVLSAHYVRPALERGTPVVLHVHELGRLVPGVLRRYGLTTHDDWWTASSRVRLVAASNEARDELARAVRCPVERIDLLESSIDTDGIRAAAAGGAASYRGRWGDLTVGACGHATDRKGIDLWLQVAVRVHQRRPDAAFVWVGLDGHRYRDQAASLGLADTVRFVGEVADPAAAIAAFDIFTLPSRHDTFALVVLEAMALARPCVAFDAGGAGRQLDDTGLVVPGGDLDAFADAIVRLLDDPDLRETLGVRARARVDAHFDRKAFDRSVRRIADDLGGRSPDRGGAAPHDASGQGSLQ